ncbi:hypothetical protein R1sor_011621 [Riccia sorocarpa]|uniref:DUF7869 domain-containing protein n=1 Tax=Riccia sorocarpa TaxID=122646 RepID=A0ABD3I1D3_9MARC
MSVQVLTAIDGAQQLPYHSMGADSLEEAVNAFVIWDIRMSQVIGRKPTSVHASRPISTMEQEQVQEQPLQLLLEAGPSTFQDEAAAGQGHRSRNVGVDQEMYFKLRQNWSNVEVVVLSKVGNIPLAEGVIFLPFANSCIDGAEVGEQNAGVLVTNVLDEVDVALLDRELPSFLADDPRTIKWPILNLRIVSNGAILGHLYKAYIDSGVSTDVQAGESSMKKKRPYNSVKRSKPDPAVQAQKKLSQRRSNRCSQVSVNEALKISCNCTNECMRKVNKKDVLAERTYFYNEPFTKRLEYILQKFDHPGFAEGKMLFTGAMTVCKPAFWTIYGFVRQTFYNYEVAFRMGQRVGFHGNNGTFKPKDTTIFAKACMKTFFQQTAEPLPHKESKKDGTYGIFYRLPKAYRRDDVYREICQKMLAVNMTPISKVAFENIWKKEFSNYGIHNTSAFAKCADCILYMNMLHRERRSAERANWEHRREMHLKHQMSGRTVYYSHRELSSINPSQYLSFIHDAMDLSKTIIPRLNDKVKTLMGQVKPLPLKLVGILNHGHEPSVVAHVAVGGLWKSYPNFTITSIAKQLRDYENYYYGDSTDDLSFGNPASHPLFEALLDKDVFDRTVLERHPSRDQFFKITEEDRGRFMERSQTTRMLPPHLFIQLDNSAKDNKNSLMMAFMSELVARGCCKSVTMSFLVVGHTHEDVDAFFSKVNAAQGGKNIETLPHFLAKVYHAQSSKTYPRLIQEIADYRSHVENYVVKIKVNPPPLRSVSICGIIYLCIKCKTHMETDGYHRMEEVCGGDVNRNQIQTSKLCCLPEKTQ